MIDPLKMGCRLESLRSECFMTQEVLAKKIGVTKDTISHIEKSKYTPRLEIIDAIADYFNVSLDWLTGRTDKKEVKR